MITIPRSTIRHVRSVFRRLKDSSAAVNKNWLSIHADQDGLYFRKQVTGAALEFYLPGEFAPREFLVPEALLQAAEARSDDPLTIGLEGSQVVARWTDHGIPQVRQLDDAGRSGADWPAMPSTFTPNGPELLQAIQASLPITNQESSRYALGCLQLRGSGGKICATDGRQVLAHRGFRFPWTDDVLIPASPVFGSRELPQDSPVEVGRIGSWAVFRIGAWTLWLAVEGHGRFPKVEDLFRDPKEASSRLMIGQEDADFLREALTHLPGEAELNRPVTLDLNGRVLVRGRSAACGPITQLVLSRSHLEGDATAINTNREFLLRAVELGFREVCLFSPNVPAVCGDGQRQYLWALLEPEGVIQDSDDTISIDSAEHQLGNRYATRPKSKNQAQACREQPAKTRLARTIPNSDSSAIEQAIRLRSTLRACVGELGTLVRSLKRDKRQSRMLTKTLTSFQQLQKLAG